jgi:valyl-tRNA synthetase
VSAAAVAAAGGPATLSIVAGECEATVHLASSAGGTAGERERARLEKELADVERQLAAARARLADDAFTTKAPPHIVAGARDREAELIGQLERLRARLG